MYKINPYHYSNSLVDGNKVTSSSSNRELNQAIEKVLKECSALIEPGWEPRHAKVIYKIGIRGYKDLVIKAEKYGRSPKALLAGMVDKELKCQN